MSHGLLFHLAICKVDKLPLYQFVLHMRVHIWVYQVFAELVVDEPITVGLRKTVSIEEPPFWQCRQTFHFEIEFIGGVCRILRYLSSIDHKLRMRLWLIAVRTWL